MMINILVAFIVIGLLIEGLAIGYLWGYSDGVKRYGGALRFWK